MGDSAGDSAALLAPLRLASFMHQHDQYAPHSHSDGDGQRHQLQQQCHLSGHASLSEPCGLAQPIPSASPEPEAVSPLSASSLASPLLAPQPGPPSPRPSAPSGGQSITTDSPLNPPIISFAAAPAFDFIVVGSGGGPIEDDLSAYFLKARQQAWHDGFVGIEAGSGLGAVSRLLAHPAKDPFFDFGLPAPPDARPEHGARRRAGVLYRSLVAFVISHAHLDHVTALVLTAGALSSPPPKSVFATSNTIADIASIFQGGIWPKLADESGELALWLRTLSTSQDTHPVSIAPALSLQAFPLTHGPSASPDTLIPHHASTAFLITNDVTGAQFVFFGDMGPDSLSGAKTNRTVWGTVASAFRARRLRTVVIECSFAASRPPELLYGHLSPPYLLEELECLARLIEPNADSLKGVLTGLQVIIVHVKEDITPPPNSDFQQDGQSANQQATQKEIILHEILELERTYGFGCQFWMANQGDRFEF